MRERWGGMLAVVARVVEARGWGDGGGGRGRATQGASQGVGR